MALYSPLSLRRRWQKQLPFRNFVYPFLVLYLAINTFWLCYDATITSNQRYRPKRETVHVTESSPLSPFYPPGMEYVGFKRAFPLWSHDFPCGPLEAEYTMRTRGPATEGIFYIKDLEASSAIFSGVTARIARSMGRRQQQKNGERTIANDMLRNTTASVCTTRLISQRAIRFRDRLPHKSFLWSVVREPVARLVSKYYQFGHVKNKGSALKTTLSRFQNYVFNSENQDYGFYFRSLGINRKMNPYQKEHETDTRELLESYDFLGVSERMDESLAVLKIILNLDIQDILYLPTQKASSRMTNTAPFVGSDGGNVEYYMSWGKGDCKPVSKPEVPLEMKEWFYSEEFEAFIEADIMFYKAVNASLDDTISKLGRELVENTVKQLQWAQKAVQKECLNIRFPCSSEGERQKETDCLFNNIGCGYKCLDEFGEKLSHNPGFQALFK